MEKAKIQIDDFAKIKKLGSLTLSPSGTKAAFTVTEGDVEKSCYKTDIWVYDEQHQPALYRLTAGEDGTAPLFWDENTILFPADRKKRHAADVTGKKTTFNRISLYGGEAEEAFVLPFACTGLQKITDTLILAGGRRDITLPDFSAMDEEEAAAAKKELEEEKDYSVFDELPFWFNGQGIINKLRTGLFLCDLEADIQLLLSDLYLDLSGFCLNPEKTKVLFWGSRFETVNTHKSEMFEYDLDAHSLREIDLSHRYSVYDAMYIGQDIFFSATTGERQGTSENEGYYRITADNEIRFVVMPDLSSGAVGSDVAGGGTRWQGTDAYYYVCTRNYRSDFEKIDIDGNITILSDDLNIISAAAGDKDPIFMIGMEKDSVQELYMKKDGQVTKLSSFNTAFMESREIAHTEHFTFKNRDEIELDGWILYPADYDPEKTYPGILTVHGGPRVAYGEAFFHEMQLFAAMGYLVFFTNPRGSSGRGDAFADIFGDQFGVRDYNDIMDFTDEVLRRVKNLDPKRLGMTGGSYGGFMANWIIGHTDRFAAVASCRSISNYISKCLTTDIGYYHNLSQLKTDPWTDPQIFWEHSPLAYANKAVTPTLFIQSDEDYRCWMGDAVQMMQALMMHGVPTRMCLFHGENHELSRSGKPKHRIRRLKEICSWFEKYLNETTE